MHLYGQQLLEVYFFINGDSAVWVVVVVDSKLPPSSHIVPHHSKVLKSVKLQGFFNDLSAFFVSTVRV